ncbi:MAG: hypothetical protein IKR41_01740 [Bacteroidales bacterium]|nr:hypothetical protein [Bacteroidales bacterium]
MRKNYLFSAFAVLMFAILCGISCQEEEVKISEENFTSSYVNVDSVLTIDGKRMEWKLSIPPRKKSLSKGILVDEATYYASLNEYFPNDYKLIDTIKFTYKKKNYSYKVLRVDRKSEPGKYFYVMIDNLDVKLDTACWAYADDESYVKKYGRLYTWNSANALAKKISMKLHVYDKDNPTNKLFDTKLPVAAKILSFQDVCDIIECDGIGNMPYNGYTIDDNELSPGHGNYDFPLYYYDVFIGGLEGSDDDYDYERGEHTLAGLRNTGQQPKWAWDTWINGWYTGLNEVGYIWLST